jgi:peptide-methionine (S)-S-oxide reductase
MRVLPTRIAVALALGFSLAMSTEAEQNPSERMTTLSSRTELVSVPVVVTDNFGAHVHGLRKEDFNVHEEGIEQPSYEQVCTGVSGHVEVVRVEFDPSLISYGDLLEVFFTAHDPTTMDRQGNDVGTQYRSVIFVVNDEQRREAERVISDLTEKKVFDRPIVTTVEPASTFWMAEDYHQNYFANHSHQPYCLFAVAPKVAKVRAKFADRIKRPG